MMFVFDKNNFNNPVNLEKVIGILAPDVPSKEGRYYILFYTEANKNFFWFYDNKDQRDFVFNNYILPTFKFLGE
jgi:hypothetical protein